MSTTAMVTSVAVMTLAAVLGGCGQAGQQPSDDEFTFVEVSDGDGREVTCVLWNDGAYSTVMSCDWASQASHPSAPAGDETTR